MVAFRNILIFISMASAMVLQNRDASTILNNLKRIDTDTKTFGTDIKNWDGTASGSVTIQNDYKALDQDVRGATQEIKTETQGLNSADSKNVVSFFTSTLNPDMKVAMDALVAKKSDAKKAGLTDLVINDLGQLSQDFSNYCAALVSITSSDQKANMRNACTETVNIIDAARRSYSSAS